MHTRRRLLLVTVTLILGTVVPAAALRFTLDTPGVAYSQAYPRSAMKQVQKALEREDCTFVRGHGINSFTTLDYRGTTLALNMFLGELAACPGVTLAVSLKKLPEDIDWRLSHEAHDNRFHAQVNLNSKRLDLEGLVIPQLKGPALPK